MRYLTWLLRIVLFVALLGFALKNDEPVVLHYFFDARWETSLVVALLTFFAVGMLFGILAMLQPWYRARRELARNENNLREARQSSDTAANSQSFDK